MAYDSADAPGCPEMSSYSQEKCSVGTKQQSACIEKETCMTTSKGALLGDFRDSSGGMSKRTGG
jgi:hypothetical protein